jgi:hypothetical protein
MDLLCAVGWFHCLRMSAGKLRTLLSLLLKPKSPVSLTLSHWFILIPTLCIILPWFPTCLFYIDFIHADVTICGSFLAWPAIGRFAKTGSTTASLGGISKNQMTAGIGKFNSRPGPAQGDDCESLPAAQARDDFEFGYKLSYEGLTGGNSRTRSCPLYPRTKVTLDTLLRGSHIARETKQIKQN